MCLFPLSTHTSSPPSVPTAAVLPSLRLSTHALPSTTVSLTHTPPHTHQQPNQQESYQKEGHSPIGTSLGKWAGLERSQPASAFSNSQHNAPVSLTFKFRDGQQCWNGPRRSLTVTVVCGTEDEVESVDEPAVCEYTMVFRTPAACAPVPEDWKAEVAWENEEDEEEEEESPRTEL